MFTGLVERLGTISSVEATSTGKMLVIRTAPWEAPLSLGESISVSGCCLTLTNQHKDGDDVLISFDIVPETLRQTTLGNMIQGMSVNIERALIAQSRLGGHQVLGHVDDTEQILNVTDAQSGEKRIRCSLKKIDADAVVTKGSITIDGVSLTIASVQDDSFDVALIPTTLNETTLGNMKAGDYVNIETDIIARTVALVIRNMQK